MTRQTGNGGDLVAVSQSFHPVRQRHDRPRDRASQPPTGHAHGQSHQQGHAAEGQGRAGHGGDDLVRIDARTDHPAPGLEGLDVGDLGGRLFLTRLGPAVVEKARTVAARDLGHFPEHEDAVGVGPGAQVLPFKLRAEGVHDHARLHVVDPEVVVLAIAQGAQGRQGGRLGLGPRHHPQLFLGLVVRNHAVGDLDRLPGAVGDLMAQDAVELHQREARHQKQAGHRQHRQQVHPAADRQTTHSSYPLTVLVRVENGGKRSGKSALRRTPCVKSLNPKVGIDARTPGRSAWCRPASFPHSG
ncbi:hypothetical protein D3C85_750450 [compost metagenome]